MSIRTLHRPENITHITPAILAVRCFVGLVLAGAIGLPASAQPIYTTSYSRTSTTASIGYTNKSEYYRNGVLYAPPYPNVPFAASSTSVSSAATLLPGATGIAYGSADAGVLRVYAKSTYPYDQSVQNIQSYSDSEVFDILTAEKNDGNGNPLAIGTPIQLQFTLQVTGSITPNPSDIKALSGNMDFGYILSTLDVFDIAPGGNQFQLQYRWGTGESGAINQPASTVTGILNTLVGNTIYSPASLHAATYVNGYNSGIPSIEVAAQNSAHIFVDGYGTTPDAFVTAETGHNYSSMAVVVPENGTLGLILCALLGWSGVQITRRRKQAIARLI